MKLCESDSSNMSVVCASASQVDLARLSGPDALTSRCISGEPAAWRQLHRDYYPVAAAFLRKLGVKENELEDTCQEVFLQLHRYLPSFRGEADFKTWLYRICATEAGKARRRWRVSSMLQTLLHRQSDAQASVVQEFDPGLARERVEAALAKLNPAERTVFVLFEMEGVPGEDIARIVNCPVATVWRRLHYARKAFRECIEAGGRSA